jgi:hypothetical protein
MIVMNREPWGPGSTVLVAFNRWWTLWDVWLILFALLSCAVLLFFRLGIRVVCPNCLARVWHKRRLKRYYCQHCDKYLDDGTMEWLDRAPTGVLEPMVEIARRAVCRVFP